ncbi:prephenate dehydratase [Brachybacterium sp. AOP25-B2-12]|uniref:prephenate dehydratase n=1 Tax=Brachybacterium sp. AOP25-B2-12 TaxID=3457710 RepID=UPI004034CE95
MRYGFLGPETTFTHQALLQAIATRAAGDQGPRDVAGGEAGIGTEPVLRPYTSVAAATAALVADEIDAVMAPIENSVEGGVSGTLDVLAAARRITIVAEEVVPITFVIAARPGTTLADVVSVASHTHAHAQVQAWLRAHLPDAAVVPASSTAGAARDLAAADPAEARGRAAICSPLAAEHFGLEVLAHGIEDNHGAQTRFVLVTRNHRIPARTGADKTTLVVHLSHNRAGALLEMLEMFRANGVNLSRIESRPIGDALGRYSFSIDVEGHLEDRRVASALRSLHRVCPVVLYLGSYPRADGARPIVSEPTADQTYDDAHAWVDGLSAMITPAEG